MLTSNKSTLIILIILTIFTLAACGTDTVYKDPNAGNTAPIANAGSDQLVLPGVTVIVNASASWDGDDDSLTYIWSFASMPTDSTATLSNSTIASPTFTADLEGDYVLALIANDGAADSDPDHITVTLGVPADSAGADLSGLNFSGMNLALADLSSANLSGASLIDTLLYQVNLGFANLSDAILTGADLTGADLGDATLTGSNITAPQLMSASSILVITYHGADLAGADLAGANLYSADLTDADFTNADLTGVSFLGATLTGADLTDADLTNAFILSGFPTGAIWNNTTCPDGTNSDDNAGNTCDNNLTIP